MRVLVLGGTGLIGRHAVDECRRRGHEVTAVAREAEGLARLPQDVRARRVDVERASPARLEALATAHDAMVVALGLDDRTRLRRPAYRAFYRVNVELVGRLVEAARRGGVHTVVVCGSFFTYLDRKRPALRLPERHVYIRSRVEQVRVVLQGARAPRVVVLELPFVFGAVPGRRPLWTPVVRHAAGPWPLLAMPGGVTMVGACEVAVAMATALADDRIRGCHPLGERTVPWHSWLEALARRAGRPRRARPVPVSLLAATAAAHARSLRGRGWEPGLDAPSIVRLFASDAAIADADLEASRAALDYEPKGLDRAWDATVRAALAS